MRWQEIDLSTYPRREHFAHFCSMANPYVGVTCQVDVTRLVQFCKEKGCSFYLAMIHAAALAANREEALRLRVRNRGIVRWEHCGTSHIELLENGTYCYCTLHHELPWAAYLDYARKERERCRRLATIEEDEDVESLYFVSSLPWLHYTGLIQPTAGGEESNPRITWGKFETDWRGRSMMPLTLLAHHGLVDGLQLASFYRNVEEELAALG